MPLKDKSDVMANNIMDAMEEAGLNPRGNGALGKKLWEAISAGIIKTIVDESDVEVVGGGGYSGEKAKIK